MKLRKLKKINNLLPKEKKKISFKGIKIIFKPFHLFINWFNNLTPLKVSLIIFPIMITIMLFTYGITKPTITVNSETVMQHIYKQELYVNSICILSIGLAIRQFIVLNWMRYRKRPPATLT